MIVSEVADRLEVETGWGRTPHGTLAGTIAEVWALEKATLMATPPAFDGFVEQSKRVSQTCLISFERNR